MQMYRLLRAPKEAYHLKPVWKHFLAVLSGPVMRSKTLAPEWPSGLASTLQMVHQLLGECHLLGETYPLPAITKQVMSSICCLSCY